MKISDLPFSFKRVLRLSKTDGYNKDGPIVRYEDFDTNFAKVKRGVYLVVQNGEVVYCGKFTNTFAKRWLYTKGEYVYHFKRGLISVALEDNHALEVYAQEEENLREQLGYPGNTWISATSIEEKLIHDTKPVWNSIGNVKE